jgi:glycosyltransferase involved in cell wall biosynthesis
MEFTEDMHNVPLISVIIPTYNRAGYLQLALESVLCQEYPCYEVLVVDDGSTDDTPAVLARQAGRVRALRQANAGPSAARNRGIREARGELVAFLDSDDLMVPGRLARQAALFVRDPELGLVAGAYAKIGPQGEALGSVVLSRADRRRLVRGEWYRNFFATPTVMARRSCFESAGLFPEDVSFGEDWDMWLRIMAGHRCRYLPGIEAKVRFHQESLVASLSEKNFQDWRAIIERDNQRLRYKGVSAKHVATLCCKRYSYYYFNKAWVDSLQGKCNSHLHTLHSIKLWPWWGLRRYLGLARYYLSDMVKSNA